MTGNRWCISIPEELQQYTINNSVSLDESKESFAAPDFGVKLIKDEQGNLKFAAYYSDIGELIKKIYYDGSSVSVIEHYRNNILYSREKYDEGKLTKKSKFSRLGKPVCIINYIYNRKNQIVVIRKSSDGKRYEVEYGYDELMRVNSRTIKVDGEIVAEQLYTYDILDRVVNYHDKNQTIKVTKINPKNELISYTITDKLGNMIQVVNKFMCSEYLGTEIDLNGHKTTINDKSYLDNIVLKKPFTSEDDLDFAISNIYRPPENNNTQSMGLTKREGNTDITNLIIGDNVKCIQKPLPISMRKQQLLLRMAS